MGPIQHEIRLGIVVESPQAPPIGVVTDSAFCTQAPFVIIILRVATHTGRPRVLIGWRQVAGSAGRSGMQPDQWKFRQVMVEGNLRFPTCLVVTSIAACSLLASVDITGLVTLVACAVQLLAVQRAHMTGIAIDFSVLSSEAEIGLVMIKEGALPAFGRMAGFAFLPVASPVFVVAFVATDTGCRQFFLKHPSSVTEIAFDVTVLSFKGELGLVMVEDCTFPISRRMAVFALFAVQAVMDVIHTVAGKTGHGCILITLVWVAAVAPNFPVFAPKGKFSFVMSADGLLRVGPSLFYMAVVACCPQSSTVGLIFLVTIDAF